MKKLLASTLALLCIHSSSYSLEPVNFDVWDVDTYIYDDRCGQTMWFDADWLYWQINPSKGPPPLVIEGPFTTGLPKLGDVGTKTVLGGENIHNSWRSGGRVTLGGWLDCSNTYGLEASYFFIPHGAKKSHVDSNGDPDSQILVTPYFNVASGQESSTGIAVPGFFSGEASLRVSNSMQGAELNFLFANHSFCSWDINFIGGFKYWNFNEKLIFTTSSPFLLIDDVWQTEDRFSVRNNFYGGQLGADFTWHYCRFSLDAGVKVALGVMCEQLSIEGDLLTNDFNGFQASLEYPGGYFAQPSNIGHHKYNQFSVIPEAEIAIGYEVCDFLTVRLGYSFFYVTKLLYAGDQIDREINPTQSSALSNTATPVLVGEARPRAKGESASMWVQGAKLSLDYSF